MNPIRVLVCDDERLLREALARLVGAAADLEVIGEAANGEEAIAAVTEHRPDVVLMDIRMPGLDGIEATRRIVRDRGPGSVAGSCTRVLILTTYDLDRYVYDALQAGASGFLLKDAPSERLRDGIRIVASGQAVLAPEATARMIEALRPGLPTTEDHALLTALGNLTSRERQICELIAEGLSNDDIARRLTISRHTVKVHVSNILTKLDAPDRIHIVLAWTRLHTHLDP